jgi:hypothetical protein
MVSTFAVCTSNPLLQKADSAEFREQRKLFLKQLGNLLNEFILEGNVSTR